MVKVSNLALAPEITQISQIVEYCKKHSIVLGADIEDKALKYIKFLRQAKNPEIENFMSEYNLSNKEGIAIMCLAESLLRIPDSYNANAIIHDKISAKNWYDHLNRDNSFFTNISTLGLWATEKIIDFTESKNIFMKLLSNLSDTIILAALKQAMSIISNQFILGSDIKDAFKKQDNHPGYLFSYDLLGESARNRDQSQFYYDSYCDAIKFLSSVEVNSKKSPKIEANKSEDFQKEDGNVYGGNLEAGNRNNGEKKTIEIIAKRRSLSLKLTAIHPRFEYHNYSKVEKEIVPMLLSLLDSCIENNIILTIDAEEARHFDLYFHIIRILFVKIASRFRDGVSNLGLVLQTYQKRAFHAIDIIEGLAREFNCVIPVRLVKGAYWDAEIKRAQELGLKEYPVFTYKHFTDLSYIACAHKISQLEGSVIFPQFATHNAYTLAIVQGFFYSKRAFELQKLFGMGNALHDQMLKEGYQSRIYAPIGSYQDLLPYLMRRLLENGANTSFISLFQQKNINNASLVQNIIDKSSQTLEKLQNSIEENKRNDIRNEEAFDIPYGIVRPSGIFGKERRNSIGYEKGIAEDFQKINLEVQRFEGQRYNAYSIVKGKVLQNNTASHGIYMPSNPEKLIGKVYYAKPQDIKDAIDIAESYFVKWSEVPVEKRSYYLKCFANLLHHNRYYLYALLIKEAGKSIDDAIAEVREAIDFALYYANQAIKILSHNAKKFMPSYTGEDNILSLHSRGIFVCISPWNFPLAIFCGQILAALVCGNTVIAKPSEMTPLIANFAVELLYEAGIHKNALQLIMGDGKAVGPILTSDSRISAVCFTGSTFAAQNINRSLANRVKAPIATIIAETGGQNAMIVDSSALLEQTSDYIVQSAFGSAGQRCSALRVLYIQEEIYSKLLSIIKGAMQEINIGNSADFSNDIGPVISKVAQEKLLSHITNMKKNGFKIIDFHREGAKLAESCKGYFVAPHIIEINKISDLEEENFGPILHVICYKSSNIDKVINEINACGYGLTFGLQSRIQEKIDYITSKIRAGNIYVNRTTIGAQVGSQPFGGEGFSGTGFKAGGPHYLMKFVTERLVSNNKTAFGGNITLLSQRDL